MNNYILFAVIEGVELYLAPLHMSFEPEINIKVGKKMIPITLPSNEYEFPLDEYFLRTVFFTEFKDVAQKIIKEIGEKVEYDLCFPVLTLNSKYKQKLMDLIETAEKDGTYYKF